MHPRTPFAPGHLPDAPPLPPVCSSDSRKEEQEEQTTPPPRPTATFCIEQGSERRDSRGPTPNVMSGSDDLIGGGYEVAGPVMRPPYAPARADAVPHNT